MQDPNISDFWRRACQEVSGLPTDAAYQVWHFGDGAVLARQLADFAAAEGEGDGSLEYWRAAHWSYFTRRCEILGRTPSERMPVILERFELIYPVTR